jgi:hypothetical protein
MDHLFICSDSSEVHLLKIFCRLCNAGLNVNPAKVKFATLYFSFQGNVISALGVCVDPHRTKPTKKFPLPHNVKCIARFVGMVNFFHKFITQFTERAPPLNLLCKKNTKFVWGSEQQRAFAELKLAIINPPVLRMADFCRGFILQSDACSTAVSAVLLQDFSGDRQPLAYSSRTLQTQEKKFSSNELECLAVLFGLEIQTVRGAGGFRCDVSLTHVS